jgi:TolA-binding protein
MRELVRLLLVVVVVAMLAGPASAQVALGSFGGAVVLVQNKGVHEELKLDNEQIEKVLAVAEKALADLKERAAKFRGLKPDEIAAKMQEEMRKINEGTYKALASILKPEQMKRLKQIDLQQTGSEAFDSADVQKGLQLSDDQKAKLKDLNEAYARDRRELARPSSGANLPGIVRKMNALRKDYLEKAEAVLTAEQMKSWKEMTGEPFEVVLEKR